LDFAQAPTPFSLLLVEDDDTVRGIVTRIVTLKFPECTIFSAENGKKGLQLFKELARFATGRIGSQNRVNLTEKALIAKADSDRHCITDG
jgi:CheY-like chemotaxis protein